MDRFEKTDDGYLDIHTGLIWKEKDEPGDFKYKKAMKLNSNAWRLPTIKELLAIVDCASYQPATRLSNIKSSLYWSSTPGAMFSDNAWSTDFSGNGDSSKYDRGNKLLVRLVRDTGVSNEI